MMSQFEKAKQLHLDGDIQGAMNGYRQLIEEDPSHAHAINMLGNACQDLEQFDEALGHYRRAIECDPQYCAAYYNLGNTQFLMKDLDDAIESYEKAVGINPEFAQCHFNLGNALLDQDRPEEAITAYQNALKYDEDDFETHHNLGKALKAFDRDDEAIEAFKSVMTINPSSPKASNEIGQIHIKHGKPELALEEFENAVETDPLDGESHFNLASTLMVLRKFGDAEAAYRRALEIDPTHSRTLECLGRLLLQLDRRDEALSLMDTWLAKDPENPRTKHLSVAWKGGPSPEQPEASYVRQEFDYFADVFDTTMQRLDYRAPKLVADLLSEILEGKPESAEIIDLGCGTGLCGPLLEPLASRLTGVDLSHQMLLKANRLNVYNVIATADATQFLNGHVDSCDAVVAADTFVYFGDLSKVFTAVNVALHKGGHFVFTTECLDDPSDEEHYRLNSTGRYSHEEAYLRTVLETSGLTFASLQRIDLRREGDAMVQGFLVAAHKPE